MKVSLTQVQKDDILQRRKEGETYKHISKDLGISYHTVYKHCKKTNSLPTEILECEELEKELEKLEKRFPGFIKKIQQGNIETVTRIHFKRY